MSRTFQCVCCKREFTESEVASGGLRRVRKWEVVCGVCDVEGVNVGFDGVVAGLEEKSATGRRRKTDPMTRDSLRCKRREFLSAEDLEMIDLSELHREVAAACHIFFKGRGLPSGGWRGEGFEFRENS